MSCQSAEGNTAVGCTCLWLHLDAGVVLSERVHAVTRSHVHVSPLKASSVVSGCWRAVLSLLWFPQLELEFQRFTCGLTESQETVTWMTENLYQHELTVHLAFISVSDLHLFENCLQLVQIYLSTLFRGLKPRNITLLNRRMQTDSIGTLPVFRFSFIFSPCGALSYFTSLITATLRWWSMAILAY